MLYNARITPYPTQRPTRWIKLAHVKTPEESVNTDKESILETVDELPVCEGVAFKYP